MNKHTEGFPVSIYVNALFGECSNKGVSSRCKEVIIVDGINIDLLELSTHQIKVSDKSPAVVIINKGSYGLIAVPLELINDKKQYQFGGSFIYSSDSRFTRAVSNAPIKLFDRVED